MEAVRDLHSKHCGGNFTNIIPSFFDPTLRGNKDYPSGSPPGGRQVLTEYEVENFVLFAYKTRKFGQEPKRYRVGLTKILVRRTDILIG